MRRIIIILSALALALSAIFYFAGRAVETPVRFHYFGVPQVKVAKVRLEVLYFVPSDQIPDQNFSSVLEDVLLQIQQFHTKEFRGLSALRYVIYPTPIIGEEPSLFYDGGDTSRGNPGAIRRIFAEVSRRVFDSHGDLYDERFVKRKEYELPIKVFVYQGVGASSGVLSVIVSYDYFRQTGYGPTVLYHEILHNLGVPDSYDYLTGVPQSDDIMGSGRLSPLVQTYVRDEIKRQMIE